MKRFLRFLMVVGVCAALLFAGLWFGGRWVLSFSVATYEGNIPVADIGAPVEITFDAKGVPQIWAQTDEDLFFSLGWLHASERLFQMELIRRMAVGELAEIFGEMAYDTDLFQRKLGIRRMAVSEEEQLDPVTRSFLERYCQGINGWITRQKILPPEFVLLRITPTPWTVVDCLEIMLYQTWFSTEGADFNTTYTTLLNLYSESLLPALLHPLPWSLPTVQHTASRHSLFQFSQFPYSMSRASNSWVVSPERSTTGTALHAADPHLGIYEVPGFWYIVGLHSQEGLDFVGITSPGLPFGIMGHTDAIAYSFTLAGVDLTDHYRYMRHPENPRQILTDHGYVPLTLIDEDIVVRGENAPRTATVFMTDRGVVVEENPDDVVALHWAGFDFSVANVIRSAMDLMRCRNFEAFRATVTQVGALNVNWLYSDKQGNIGYQLGAPIPRRTYTNTFQPLDGANPATAWQGYYPLLETPASFNPGSRWLASCNNEFVPEDWPYAIPGFFDPYRIARVSELLSQQDRYSPEDFRAMQMDIVSGIARQWKHVMAEGAQQLGQDGLAQEILAWDSRMTTHSSLAALFVYWDKFLTKFLFEDDLGEQWETAVVIVDMALTQHIEEIIDDRRTPDHQETLADIAAKTLEYVLPLAKEKTLGDISLCDLEHPLSAIPGIDLWLHVNRGGFSLPGDGGTLNANALWYDKDTSLFYTEVGPSMRFVLDWADVDAFAIHTTLGQSGNPLSPHYDDFLEIWRQGKAWNVPFTKEAVYAERSSLLTLSPGL